MEYERSYYSEAEFFDAPVEDKIEEIEPSKAEDLKIKLEETANAIKIFPPDIYEPVKELVDGARYIMSTIDATERVYEYKINIKEEPKPEDVKGTVVIEFVDVFLNKIKDSKRLSEKRGNIVVAGDFIDGYRLLEPKTQSVNVLEDREYKIVFTYDPYYNDTYNPINPNEPDYKPPISNLGGILAVEFVDTAGRRLKEDKVYYGQYGYKDVYADEIVGYSVLEPSIVGVQMVSGEIVTVRFTYEKNADYDEDFEPFISGTVIVSYRDIESGKSLRNDLVVSGTHGGTYYAPDIEGYKKLPPSSEELNIVFDKQTIKHTFFYAEDYEVPDYDFDYEHKDYEPEKIVLETIPDSPMVDVDVEKKPKPEVIRSGYKAHTVDIIDDFNRKLRSMISEYASEVQSILSEFNFSAGVAIDIQRKPYNYRTRDILNKNLKHVSDMIIGSQIKRGQGIRMFRKVFNKKSLQKQLKSCKSIAELRARYYEGNYIDTNSLSDLVIRRGLADKRHEYDEKYKQNFLDLYKYLNSSVVVLSECLRMSIKEIQCKAVLVKREGIKLK